MKKLISLFDKSSQNRLIFALFLIGYFILLLAISYEINIWVDETFTLDTTSRNIFEVINQSYNFEGQPPVYFLLLTLWRLISPGIFFAKLFSILITGLSAFAFYYLSRLMTDVKNARWMVIIFLINPFTVWAALELRTYSLLILLSTVSIYFFLQYYLSNKNKYLYLFLIVSLIGIYTQYFFTIQIAALAFSFLIFKGWKPFFKLCLYLSIIAFLSLFNLPFIFSQLEIIQPRNSTLTTFERIMVVLRTPQNFVLSLQLVPLDRWVRWVIKIFFILSILFAYYKLYRSNQLKNKVFFEKINFILTVLLITIVFFITATGLSGILYLTKYMTIAFPLFILLFSLYKIYDPLKRQIIYTIISIYYVLLLIFFYNDPIKGTDYKLITKYVATIEHKNEPILFYNNALGLTFRYYYTGLNSLNPLPHAVQFDTSFMKSLKDTFELKQSIDKIKHISNSFLFVSDPVESPYVQELSRKDVDLYLNNNYNVTFDTLFYGRSKNFPLRIRRIEKK